VTSVAHHRFVLAGSYAQFGEWCVANGVHPYHDLRAVTFVRNLQSVLARAVGPDDEIIQIGTFDQLPDARVIVEMLQMRRDRPVVAR
jgi:hypothetical protein